MKIKLNNPFKRTQAVNTQASSSQINNAGRHGVDNQSLASNYNTEKPNSSFRQSLSLAQQYLFIAPKAVGQLLPSIDPTSKLVKLEGEKDNLNIAIHNLFEDKPFVQKKLTAKKSKLDRKICFEQTRSNSKLEIQKVKRDLYLSKKSKLQKTWQASSTSEKLTSVAMVALLPVTASLVAGNFAIKTIKNTESYTKFQDMRDERNEKYTNRQYNYIEKKNEESANKARIKAGKLININGEKTIGQPQHPMFRIAVAIVRGAHIVRNIPFLGLSSKWDYTNDDNLSDASSINSEDYEFSISDADVTPAQDDTTDFERFQAKAKANINSMPQIEEENEDAQSEISSLHTNNGQKPLGNYSNFDSIPLYDDNNNKAGSIVTAIHHQNDEDRIETIATQRPNGYSKFREEL